MTSDARSGSRILGRLRSADGKGLVRIEDRYDTDIDDLWAAITDPGRLARWLGRVEGDLRPGGTFRLYTADLDSDGRVEACEPPRRLVVRTWDLKKSEEHLIDVTLVADGEHTDLVLEERGMPVELLAAYGAGIQVHVEDLGAHLAGREHCDADARWAELEPAYDVLVADGK